MKTFFVSLLILSGIAASAQSVKIKPTDLKQPETFGLTILAVAKNGNAKQWKQLLSKELNEKGNGFVKGHFDIWRNAFKSLLEQYADIAKITVKLENESLLKIDRYPVIILKENGRYYINER